MSTFDKVSMFNHIEVREKPDGDIRFWNVISDVELTAIYKKSKSGNYLLFHEDRKDLSKFFRNKLELFQYVSKIWEQEIKYV